LVEQQAAFAGSSVSSFAAATTYSGGETWFVLAQANFCRLVKQQQPRQH
jgi:hypothetical protein